MRAAVFIERDGVLVRSKTGNGSPVRLDQVEVNPDAREALARLREAGFLLFATTNQPLVTSGDLSRRELDLMHAALVHQLDLVEVLVCPHAADDGCLCRMPQPGLLHEASRRHAVDLDHSYVLGDKWVDAQLAEATGATSVLIRSPQNGQGHHDFVVEDLAGAVTKILENAAGLGTLRAMAGPRQPPPTRKRVGGDGAAGGGATGAASPRRRAKAKTG